MLVAGVLGFQKRTTSIKELGGKKPSVISIAFAKTRPSGARFEPKNFPQSSQRFRELVRYRDRDGVLHPFSPRPGLAGERGVGGEGQRQPSAATPNGSHRSSAWISSHGSNTDETRTRSRKTSTLVADLAQSTDLHLLRVHCELLFNLLRRKLGCAGPSPRTRGEGSDDFVIWFFTRDWVVFPCCPPSRLRAFA